jgi:flagellar hook-length control protein FliK
MAGAGATPALAADAGMSIDLAALLAQLAPVSRRATMPGHAGSHSETAAEVDSKKVPNDGNGQESALSLATQVLAVPITIAPSVEPTAQPKPDSTLQARLSAVRDIANTTANAGQSTVPIAEVAARTDPKAVTAEESTQAAAIVAAPVPNLTPLAAQPAANADHGSNFETILTHTQGDNAAAAIATAQASTQAEAANRIAAAVHNASPSLVVSTPVGNPGWAAEVSDKLVWMVGRQEQRVELVLNPPQLGRVEVSLSLNGDQATAQFLSTNPVVREALESAMPRLREMLADGGITLGQTHVGSDSSGQAANQRESGDNRASFGSGNALSDTTIRAGSAAPQWFGRGRGLVDVFA